MNNVEALIELQLPADLTNPTQELQQSIDSLEGVEQFMLVTNEGNYAPAQLTFSYSAEVPVLDIALTTLQGIGCSVTRIQLNLPSTLSGIADVYDARDTGSEIQDRLASIAGIKELGVNNNGVVSAVLFNDNPSQDKVLRALITGLNQKNK